MTNKRRQTMKRPAMTMCHANPKGTGTAIRLELHPARPDADGSILAMIATQKSTTTAPSFDWYNSISVRLCFMDLTKVLQVFRGYVESIADGKGIFLRTANGCTVVRLAHRIEPVPGYVLDVSHKPNGGETVCMRFEITYDEAFALSEAIGHAMLYVSFGVPVAE